jgi:hypothetical protein
MPAKECVAQQQHDAEHQHLRGEQTDHRRRDREPGSFANVARDLCELDSRELHFQAREMNSVLGYIAEQLRYSTVATVRLSLAKRVGTFQQLHNYRRSALPIR